MRRLGPYHLVATMRVQSRSFLCSLFTPASCDHAASRSVGRSVGLGHTGPVRSLRQSAGEWMTVCLPARARKKEGRKENINNILHGRCLPAAPSRSCFLSPPLPFLFQVFMSSRYDDHWLRRQCGKKRSRVRASERPNQNRHPCPGEYKAERGKWL